MFRSAVASLADKATRRPTWLERNGTRMVEVCGYSPVEQLLYGVFGAALILSPIGIYLVSTL
jgi:hypothetical protein